MDVQITGHIYLIENKVLKKSYIGQAWSHRKNKGKYKPFGFEGRFREHISEALCNTKKKQCRYLNNSIRLNGKDTFTVSLLHECSLNELDTMEIYYIKIMNTLYPNGYNLTPGGKGARCIKNNVEQLTTLIPQKRGGCKERSLETRAKISKSNKDIVKTDIEKIAHMKLIQEQHMSQKYKRFEKTNIDINNLDQYIYERKNFIIVKVDNIRTSFVGKYESNEILRIKAKEFLIKVVEIAMLSN